MVYQEPGVKYTRSDLIRLKFIAKLCSGNVLDVGCGSGELRKYLPEGTEYIGVDTEPSGKCYYGSAYSLFFKNKSFDTVVLSEILEHLENPLQVLEEVKRITRDKVIISVPNPYNLDQIASVLVHQDNIYNPNHINLFGDNEIRSLCFNAGFTYFGPRRFYTKIPGLNWLSPIRSCFGEWSIYEVT